jgi:hypothetical protein
VLGRTEEAFAGLPGRAVDWQVSAAGTIWTVTDISAERAEREGLLWSANHDELTGLANRLALTRHLDTLLAHRQTSTPAALLMLDLDRFKPINDQHGHAAGDAMLRAVAQALTGCVRGGDLAVRLGGDEFAVLLPLCAADAARRARRGCGPAAGGGQHLKPWRWCPARPARPATMRPRPHDRPHEKGCTEAPWAWFR